MIKYTLHEILKALKYCIKKKKQKQRLDTRQQGIVSCVAHYLLKMRASQGQGRRAPLPAQMQSQRKLSLGCALLGEQRPWA